jgi:hypothetical protein
LRYGVIILLVSFLVVLPQAMLQSYLQYFLPTLIAQGSNIDVYNVFAAILTLIGIFLNPVMLFILMYLVGRNLRLNSVYLAVLGYLFLGGLLGGLVGRAVIYYASPVVPKTVIDSVTILTYSLESAIPVVFAGFTAAAIAYFGKARGQTTTTSPAEA